MADENVLKEFLEYWQIPKTENEKRFSQKRMYNAVIDAKRYINMRYGSNIPDANTILTEYYKIFEKSDETTTSLSDMYLLRTMKEFLANPSILFGTYDEVKDVKWFWDKNSKPSYRYTASAKNNRRIFAHDIFHNFIDYRGRTFSKEGVLEISGDEKKKTIEDIVSKVKITQKKLTDEFLNTYINALINTLEILKKLGALGENLTRNNRERQAMGLPILAFDEKTAENSYKYSLNDLFDPEFLRRLSLEKLVLIHGFYSNRLKRVSNALGMGIFICAKSDAFDTKNKDINTEEMIRAYLQYNAMDGIYKEAVSHVYADLDKYKHADDYKGKRYVLASSQKIYNDFFKKYEKAYLLYSGGFLGDKGISANMDSDFDMYFYTQVMDYFQKNASIETILVTAIESFDKVNWGYIPETRNGQNSIKRNKKNILLGFDMEGLNMPVRLHMPLDMVRDFFKNFNKSYNIPNYIGNEDFALRDNEDYDYEDKGNMGISILMPLSPKHRKELIKYVKENITPKNTYYNFAKHIQCMQYDNSLNRIQRWKNINGRNERSYTNLLTGEEVEPVRQK